MYTNYHSEKKVVQKIQPGKGEHDVLCIRSTKIGDN
jgi:hypothetical protein